jgi:hypothetical protein
MSLVCYYSACVYINMQKRKQIDSNTRWKWFWLKTNDTNHNKEGAAADDF